MQEVVQLQHQHYILATESRLAEENHVLKQGESFAIFGPTGDIAALGLGEQGLYHHGTRFLSRLRLTIDNHHPLLLSSSVTEDNDRFGADLTNPDVTRDGVRVMPRDMLHLFRSRLLWQGTVYERLRLWSYARTDVTVTVRYEFDADYADIFEVRGTARSRRGRKLAPSIEQGAVVLAYQGLDDIVRETRLSFAPMPDEIATDAAQITIALAPRCPHMVDLTVGCGLRGQDVRRAMTPVRAVSNRITQAAAAQTFEHAASEARAALEAATAQYSSIETSSEQFNRWVGRSVADIRMMVTAAETGPYPYAGVPWFSTAFGRDGIITALELLWINPSIARGVLTYLASLQADEVRLEQDAEPGKILHEVRGGEMPALGEVPFRLYYGSVDSTPLFVMLCGAYYRRTADLPFVESVWPNIERALAWIDQYGDADRDGFVEYSRRSEDGLIQQGWKDSTDSVFHQDGILAEPPIALCEVQAYVYDAKRSAAEIAEALGDSQRARALRQQADRLRQRFQKAFWIEELGTYALALDGHKRPCRVRTSNAGQCLFAGIASRPHAERIAGTLLADESFSGWGIRTVATSEVTYNPMSYHNGSIWPHDNALIAAGFARCALSDPVIALTKSLFDASRYTPLHRLPELFCGFHRRSGEGPTRYPVACAPQAWASGAVFLLLQSCLGLTIDARHGRVVVDRGQLPRFLSQVRVEHLVVGNSELDLQFEWHPQGVGIRVLRREGDVDVTITK